MKIINASSKTITLLNGKKIDPKDSININVDKASSLYEQIKSLEKMGLLDILD